MSLEQFTVKENKIKPYKFPDLVIEKHDEFYIVRDDLLEGGSKRRFIDRLIRESIEDGVEEFVYGGCPAKGYAQLSLTLQTKHFLTYHCFSICYFYG